MRLAEVQIGGVYEVLVSQALVPVRVDRRTEHVGRTRFEGTNLVTKKTVRLTAARCRRRFPSMEGPGAPPEPRIAPQYGHLHNLAAQARGLYTIFARLSNAARVGQVPDKTELHEAMTLLEAMKTRLAGL